MTDEVHEVYRDRKVHVLAEKCSSCIFKKPEEGRIMGLAPGRVGRAINEAEVTAKNGR